MTTETTQLRYRMATRVATVAGVFVAMVVSLLIYGFIHREAKHPAEEQARLALQAAVDQHRDDEKLAEQLRALDVHLREFHFQQRAFAAAGASLLLVGVVVLLASLKAAATLRRELPMPEPLAAPRDLDAETAGAARWAVTTLLLMLVGAALGLGYAYTSKALSSTQGAASTAPATAATPAKEAVSGAATLTSAPAAAQEAAPESPPSDEEVAKAWPRFRGPAGDGVSRFTNVPTKWNASGSENILWKTAVPLPGNSSPVVWDKHVFLSGADEKQRKVFCFDSEKGSLVWQQEAPGTPASTAAPPKVNEETGFAASTTATDGRRVYAIFANGDLAAFSVDGKFAWSKSLGIPENSYGHAASLLMYKTWLIVPMDQGSGKDGKSKLYIFEGATGKLVREIKREISNCWTTPIVIRVSDRDELITAADPWVIAYDLKDGSEIWRAKCLRQDVGPSPVFADGVVYVANAFPAITALRADGSGDVTKTHVLWRGEDNLPDTCSPLATKEFFFALASEGILTCYDARKGDMLWSKEFDSQFTSSPSLVGNYVYLIGAEGKCWVVEPDREDCKIIAESDLGEKCAASPAFQDGRMYVRGQANLFCVGK